MRASVLRVVRYAIYVWLGYLLIGNVVLNTALGSALINRKPEAFTLEWRFALTLWPAHAIAWDVHARGHVRRIVWHAHADRATGSVALLSLLARELRMPGIRAHEVRAVIEQVDHDRLPPPPREGGWTLRFDRIATDSLRSIRAEDYRIEGGGTAEFGMLKQLRGGPIEIFPSRLNMAAANVYDLDTLWLSNAAIEAGFAMSRHARDQAQGLARLKFASASLAINGRTPTLLLDLGATGDDNTTALRAKIEPGNATAVDSGGAMALQIAMDRGIVVADSRFDLEVPVHSVEAGATTALGQAVASLSIKGEDIHAGVLLPPPPGSHGHVDARLVLKGRELPFDGDWDALLPRTSGRAEIKWRFGSLRWFAPLFARVPWLDIDGAGEIDAHLIVEQGRLAEGSRLNVPAVDAKIDVLDNRFTGRASAIGTIEGAGDSRQTRLALKIGEFRMSPRDEADRIYVRGRDLMLDLVANGHLADMRESLDAHLRFERAEVPDLTVYNRYLPNKGFRFVGGRGSLSGDLRLDAAGDVGTGSVRVGARGASLALGDLDISADVELDTRLRRADLAKRQFHLDGSTVSITHLRALDDERALDHDWWARVTIDRGRIDWARPLEVDASLSATARNAGLLLSLFAHKRDYPRWVFGLVDAGEAQLEGRLRMNGHALSLDPFRAGNRRFDVQTRLRIADRQPLGALLIGWRRLAVAVELARGERDWHMIKAKDWFGRYVLPD